MEHLKTRISMNAQTLEIDNSEKNKILRNLPFEKSSFIYEKILGVALAPQTPATIYQLNQIDISPLSEFHLTRSKYVST